MEKIEKDTNTTQHSLPQQEEDLDLDICPSFSFYSSANTAQIAAIVAAESRINTSPGEGEDEIEFSFVSDSSEAFCRTVPVFPVFNRDLAIGHGDSDRVESSVVVPLGKLLLEARDENERVNNNDSCSSSEAEDELENIPAGTYCVWRPREAETPSPSRCKKSKSTGSASKRWKFRDFMRRSNSDGKDSFVFLTPKQKESPKTVAAKGKGAVGGGSAGGARWTPSAHEALYVRNRAVQEGNRRKSYLPYRKDLVGFFANVSVLGKSFPHF